MSNILKIKGHSGCGLDVIDDGHELRVVKTSKESYLPRLEKQCKKQKETYEYLAFSSSFIKVPDAEWENNSINMKYIHGQSFIEFFEKAGTNEITDICTEIINYIEDEIARSPIDAVSQDVFEKKWQSTYEAATKSPFYNDDCYDGNHVPNSVRINESFNRMGKWFNKNNGKPIEIPMGVCHGDMTFSNIIFNSAGLWLIDFLDSFVETPLQDIVKLRQDTLYEWSTLMVDASYNKVRIKTVFEYIDKKLDEYFKAYDWYKYYNMLQYMNILRILPYVKEANVNERLLNILKTIDL